MPGFTDPWIEGPYYVPVGGVHQVWCTYDPRDAERNGAPARGHVHLETSGTEYPVKSASYLMMFGLNADEISAGAHDPWGYYAHRPGGGEQFSLWPKGFDYEHFMKLRRADGY